MWIKNNCLWFIKMHYFMSEPRRVVKNIIISDDCTVLVAVSAEGREETRKYIVHPIVYARLRRRLIRVADNISLTYAEPKYNISGTASLKIRSYTESEHPIGGYDGVKKLNKVYDLLDKFIFGQEQYEIVEPDYEFLLLINKLNKEPVIYE